MVSESSELNDAVGGWSQEEEEDAFCGDREFEAGACPRAVDHEERKTGCRL